MLLFDVVRQKKSPMDQLIPHLTIQCGEKHVTPLCQALLPIMTGRGIALFLPRYALGTMRNEQVRKHFQFHDRWAKSLTAITLSPQVTHLDQVRIEYHEDGTTTQRSTREWIASLKEKDGTTSALCDAVNGTNDNKAYLVTPSHYFQRAQYHWQQYKSRLFPPNHREARFRDNLPGLPDVIVIRTEIQANVQFLEQMSMAPTWYQETERQTRPNSTSLSTNYNNHTTQTASQNSHNEHLQSTNQAWSTPSEASNKHRDQSLGTENQRNNREQNNPYLGSEASSTTSIEEKRSTTSTRSMTMASRMNNTDSRFHELEQLIKRQQQDSKTSGKISSDRLNHLERQFTRKEELDTKLSAVQTQLEHSNVKLEQSAKEQKILSDNLEVLSKETSHQFSDMNNKIILTMESQHDMSHTMLEMRKQFERLSQFMTAMADKMEIAMTRQHTDGTTNLNTLNLDNPRANKRSQHGGGSSVHSGSTTSKTSQDSSQDTSVYRSPEKKKQHTRSNHRIGEDKHDNRIVAEKIDKDRIQPIEGLVYQEEKGEGFAMHRIGGEDPEDMSESSDVCLYLEDAFERLQPKKTLHQARGQHHIGNLEVNAVNSRPSTSTLSSPSSSKHDTSAIKTPSSFYFDPMESQYKSSTNAPDGALTA